MVKLCWTVELIISLMIWHGISVYPHEMLTHQPTGIFPSISQYLSLTPPKHLPGNCQNPPFFPVTSVPSPFFKATISSRHHLTKQPGPPPVVPSSPQPRRSSRSTPQGRSPSDTIRRRLSLPDMATMAPWDHGTRRKSGKMWKFLVGNTLTSMKIWSELEKDGRKWWQFVGRTGETMWKPWENREWTHVNSVLGGSELWKKRGIHLRNPRKLLNVKPRRRGVNWENWELIHLQMLNFDFENR